MRYILVFICYINRFVISFICKTINVENVLWCLRFIFIIYYKFYVFYFDKDQHFLNDVFINFLHSKEIAINFNSSDASKSINIIEIYNKLLKEVLRKNIQIGIK